jgi:NAD(P)-dependent dehydrogenase (short-subunit alcohol dehydrogenase family)
MIGAAIERHSTLDVLVNNAGIMDRFLPAAETLDELWERVLKVNLTGHSPTATPTTGLPAICGAAVDSW